MGDYYSTVVDLEATDENMDASAQIIIDWLVERNIILPDLSSCIMSNDKLGYAPGSNYWYPFADVKEDCHDQHLRLHINGLEVVTKRHVTFDYQGRFDGMICPNCQAINPTTQDAEWGKAVEDWHNYTSEGNIACKQCSFVDRVAKWPHVDPWFFSHLSFVFWNWPPFSQRFLDEFSKEINHPVAVLYGKL